MLDEFLDLSAEAGSLIFSCHSLSPDLCADSALLGEVFEFTLLGLMLLRVDKFGVLRRREAWGFE